MNGIRDRVRNAALRALDLDAGPGAFERASEPHPQPYSSRWLPPYSCTKIYYYYLRVYSIDYLY